MCCRCRPHSCRNGNWRDPAARPVKAVILAGARFPPVGGNDSKPKPMVEIGGPADPLAYHEDIFPLWINDFIICLGYKGFRIKEYFFHYNLYSAI